MIFKSVFKKEKLTIDSLVIVG